MARDEVGALRFLAYLEETGLFDTVRAICLAYHVTPRDIYLDGRGPTIVAARLETWWVLSARARKSAREVGDMFGRDPSSVMHAMRKLGAHAVDLGVELSEETVRRVAEAAARATHESLRASGARVGRLYNKSVRE